MGCSRRCCAPPGPGYRGIGVVELARMLRDWPAFSSHGQAVGLRDASPQAAVVQLRGRGIQAEFCGADVLGDVS